MHDVDFQVYSDEVVVLVGGNSAGKSTLLEHLNATLVPDKGELVVDGTLVTEADKAHARSEVGFVFQNADTQLFAPTVLDDALLAEANLHPPTAVRVARETGLATSAQPVTAADLVAFLGSVAGDSDAVRAASVDGNGRG